VNTKGFGGHKVAKNVKVYTSDPVAPVIDLNITGNVEPFASIVPPNVRLKGRVGTPIKESVTITPDKKYPFAITGDQARKGESITYKINKIQSPKGPSYVLTVENKSNEPGRYFDTINLTTDNAVNPEIRISVYGDILPPDKPSEPSKPLEKAKPPEKAKQ
jgi:hypothetical protein